MSNKPKLKMSKVRAIVYLSNGDIEIVTSSSGKKRFDLKELQTIVDGRIQSSKMDKTQDFIYNEEGLLKHLPVNPHYPKFLGNVILIDRKMY